MKFIQGIEGDYIETKKDHLFFDVKGLLHPDEYIICFLRFFPAPEGERIKDDIKFRKIYNLEERYALLREKYPNYLFFSRELDLEVQGVKKEEIKKIYTPRIFFKKLLEKNLLSSIELRSRELCELFISQGNLSEDSIGITGSTMVGLNTKDSDIDIIIYGTQASLNFQEKLERLFKKSNKIRKYNKYEYKIHYEWRFGGSDIPFGDFLKSEQRKQHQGKFMDKDFFVRYIKSPEDWKGNFYDYKYKNLGRIKLKAEIINSEDSIFTPCSYKINPLTILNSDINLENIKTDDISEINSFRGRFCEQAREKETVLVEGKLEKVMFKNELEYFRILLNNPIQDKMIII
ncbi:MAG: nucleotidyltransferase domain-containing protein [Candidatus Hermodarchaeota archaeon]